MKHPDVRVLTIEERILLAKRHIDKKDMVQALVGGPAAILKDTARVHQLLGVLGKYKVPALSTELTKDDCVVLYDRNNEHLNFVLDYLGVFEDAPGQELQRLFNTGNFTLLSRPNVRLTIHVRLTVPDVDAKRLEELHRQWYETGVCLMVHQPADSFWFTPGPVQSDSNSQRYEIALVEGHTLALPGSKETETNNLGDYMSWEVQLDEYLDKRPELGYLRGHFESMLLPRRAFSITGVDGPKDVLLWRRNESRTLRIVGVTQQGLLLLTDSIHQDLIYDSQLPIIEALETGEFTVTHHKK